MTSSASVGVTLSGRWRGEEAQRLPPLEGVYLQPPGLNPGCGFAFWPGWHVGSALPAGAKLTARAMPASSAMTSLRVLLIFTLWGAKIRCPPKKSVICRQDANFGTTHALTSATQKASPPAGQAVSSSTTMRKRSLIPPCPQAVAASDGITRIRESADAELVLGEREAGAQGRVGDNEVTTSEASLSAPSARLGRESHRDGNEVAAPTNGSPLSSGKNPAGRRRNQRRLLESRLRSPAQCTSLRHRE